MFRAISALSLVAASLLTAQVASADWLMLSAYDFFPFSSTTKYDFSGGRGGYVSSEHPVVKAAVRIPLGKRFTSIYCQVLDASTTKDISITLGELRSTDNNSSWGERTMASTRDDGRARTRQDLDLYLRRLDDREVIRVHEHLLVLHVLSDGQSSGDLEHEYQELRDRVLLIW